MPHDRIEQLKEKKRNRSPIWDVSAPRFSSRQHHADQPRMAETHPGARRECHHLSATKQKSTGRCLHEGPRFSIRCPQLEKFVQVKGDKIARAYAAQLCQFGNLVVFAPQFDYRGDDHIPKIEIVILQIRPCKQSSPTG
jgi:hypothetical protein